MDTIMKMSDAKTTIAGQQRASIRKIMARRSLKVAPWCKKAGISEGTLRNFLSGHNDSMQSNHLQLLADAAGVTMAELLTGNDLADAEIALTDAVKTIVQVLLHHELATPQSLAAAFDFQLAHYREKNLPNAITVTAELRAYVTGEPRASEKQVLHRILQLPPPKPRDKPPGKG